MLLALPDVLSADQVAYARGKLELADWGSGLMSAGHQGARVKNNRQLAETDPVAVELGEMILQALGRNAMFLSFALPLRVLPPMFNRYGVGETFGTHVDGAIRNIPGTHLRLRTDLSCTLFLCEPDEYDGGELCVEHTYGSQSVKLPAGHMVVYPSTSLHHVAPVTRGTRTASFFWLQSLVRDNAQRALMFDLDTGIQQLSTDHPDHPAAVKLTGVYHNLLRLWAQT
ncbi:MAG: Fe2+-dependent dioxygenase [Rubrivivax sp.]